MKKIILFILLLPFFGNAGTCNLSDRDDYTHFKKSVDRACDLPVIIGEVIDGPDFLCDNHATYSLEFEQEYGGEVEVNWGSSSNVLISSSDNGHAEIETNGSGAAFILATITITNSCGTTSATVQFDFWIGAPIINSATIFGPNIICENGSGFFSLPFSQSNGATSINVSWQSSSNVTIVSSDNGHADVIATGVGDAYIEATISLTNDCGTTTLTVQKDFWIGKPDISNATIFGTDLMCENDDAFFTLLFSQQNGSTNVNVSWQSSSNIAITNSGNGHADVLATGVGAAFIKATITLTNSCGTTTLITQKDFWIGEPATNGSVIGADVLCLSDASSYILLFNQQNGATNVSVSWQSSSNVTITNSGNGHADVIATGNGAGYLTAIISLTNSCGTSTTSVQKTIWIGEPSINVTMLGPELICENDDATFDLVFNQQNGASNVIVSWQSSSNVSIIYGGGEMAGISATGTGAAFITATITATNSCGTTTIILQKDFWIGEPVIGGGIISGPNDLCLNDNATYYLLFNQLNGSTNINVNWQSSSNLSIGSNDNGHADIVVTGPGIGWIQAVITLTNNCGTETQTVQKSFWIGKPQISGTTISGSSVLCNNVNGTFNLSYSPIGQTNVSVSWQSSSNVSITSSSNNQVNVNTAASGNGDAFVIATITLTNSCGTVTETIQKDFWVGGPKNPNPQISGPWSACFNQATSFPVSFDPPDGYTNINNPTWTVTTGFTMTSDPTQAIVQPYIVGPVATGTLTVQVFYTNACGYGQASDQFNLYFASPNPGCTPSYSQVVNDPKELINKGMIEVYPNPSNGIVKLKLGKDFSVGNEQNIVQVFDMQGKEVLRTSTENIVTNMDLTSFNPGVYLVKVYNSQNVDTQRLILEN
ncbi:MAG: T9SS type A sorting domain-containing protein [Crocinitomicaceae bacterium]